MAFGLNYSSPGYSPGKLVDEFGQGSSNASYGRTVDVTGAEQVDMYGLDPTVPAGAVHANATPLVRALDAAAAVFGVLAFFAGYKTLGKFAMGAAVGDVLARQLFSNYDSAVSLIPLNTKVL